MLNKWWAIPKIAFESRNPVSWLWGVLWFVFYPFIAIIVAVLGAIFGLVQLGGFWHLGRVGSDARISDAGIEVFSKRKGPIAIYAWSNISELRRIFDPPLIYWELVLRNGEEIPLPLAELEPGAFRDRGITVHEKHQFRSAYKHDG